MTAKKSFSRILQVGFVSLRLVDTCIVSIIRNCFHIMTNLSRKIRLGKSVRTSHQLSIHDSSGQGIMNQVGGDSAPTIPKSKHKCENSSDHLGIKEYSYRALSLTVFLSFIGFCFGDIVGLMGVLCIIHSVCLGLFMSFQVCRLYISGYFLPSLICLFLFHVLSLISIKHAPDNSVDFLWPWYIVSIPLYLVPVAFAFGLYAFYYLVLKVGKSNEHNQPELL